MPRPRWRFIQQEISRHGQTYWYFRRGKGSRVRLWAKFGTPEFEAQYFAALQGLPIERPAPAPRAAPKYQAPRKSYVYFAVSAGMVKIGVSTNTKSRLASLATGCSQPVRIIKKIPGDAKLERELHQRFAGLRSHGEWFHYEGALWKFIRGQQDAEQREPPERPEIIL